MNQSMYPEVLVSPFRSQFALLGLVALFLVAACSGGASVANPVFLRAVGLG